MSALALWAVLIIAALVGVILALFWDEYELPWEERPLADILRDLLREAGEGD